MEFRKQNYLGKPARERKNRPVVTFKDHKTCTLFLIEQWDKVSQRDRLIPAYHLTVNAANKQSCAMPTVILQHEVSKHMAKYFELEKILGLTNTHR